MCVRRGRVSRGGAGQGEKRRLQVEQRTTGEQVRVRF